jgi:poly-gamma-glutamate synthesis protein (capsule biosynthesis protein)
MLDRIPGQVVLDEGPGTIFAGVGDILSAADIALVNLECAIADGGAPLAKSYTFRAPPQAIAALTAAGVDVAQQANNHALDYGPDALLETLAALAGAGIASPGGGADDTAAYAPVFVEREGLRIAFLAFAAQETGLEPGYWGAGHGQPGIAVLDTDRMQSAIAAAAAESDHVVLMVHFGVEGSFSPTDFQRYVARAAIDAGATLVIGTHPHVVQEVEEYGGGLIAYSLGNFVFDGFEGYPGGLDTAILRVELTRDSIAGWELLEGTIDGRGLPHVEG